MGKKGKQVKPKAFDGVYKPAALNPVQKHELAQLAVKNILAGIGRKEILVIVEKNMPVKLSTTGIINIYNYAMTWLEASVELDAEVIVRNHIANYEKIYAYFESIRNTRGMLKALYSKEKMLGLFRETKIDVKKQTHINISQNDNYDTSKLSIEDKKKFEYLLGKATA